MKAMLFAAGLGTRLKPFTNHHPKALVAVNNKTLLERNIRYLQRFGIKDVIINVHHFAPQVEDLLRDNKGFGSTITVSDERAELLETGGGLKKAAPYFAGERDFVVMNVDILTNLDLHKLVSAHLKSKAIATLAVMKRDSSRHFLFDNNMQLCGWRNNKTGEERMARPSEVLRPYAFSGIQVLSQSVLQHNPFDGKFSLVDLYLHLAKDQPIRGYDHTGDLLIDVGKPESIEQAEDMFA
jgi:N-acetyl-alpha-D-muramate 1-phosphate uridylyltransferase